MTGSETRAGRRIGVFGGAFDPPHLGHVALVQEALVQLALDEVRVIPTGQSWHRQRPVTAAHHRLAMTRLAFEGEHSVVVDDREIQREGPSYTIDTLQVLAAQFPHVSWCLLMGEDQSRSLKAWHRVDELVQKATIHVAQRDPEVMPWADAQMPGWALKPLPMPMMPHSATAIRSRVALGLSIDGLVSPGVRRYIEEHHLYQRPHD